MTDMGIKKTDVPIILNDISYEDSYQEIFKNPRRLLTIYTMSFTSKFFLYNGVTSSKVIKTVQVDQYFPIYQMLLLRER